MAMKKIPPHEQALISASVYLNSFQRAIEELVYNSLDAESTSIAIRVFIQENFIQALDNGVGITKKDFKLLGQKYATSKYIDNSTLKSAPDKYGFRGMSLASIIGISETVKISSKYQEETWMKKFCNGKAEANCSTTTRPSKGTTVEILGFLYNLNIQKKSIDPLKELHNIKLGLEQLSLIHCNVSISLRDDSKNEVVFRINKNRDMYQTLESLFSIEQKDFQDLQVEKNKYKIKALIGIHMEHIKRYQWIYLNGKIIFKTKLHKKLNACLNKDIINKTKKNVKNKDKFSDENNLFNSNIPFYFIFVSCPNFDFDIIYKSKETFVEFKNWKEIDKLIDKLAKFYYSSVSVQPINFNPDLKQKESKYHSIDTRQKVKEIMEKILNNNTNKHKITQLQKGVKGKNIKRKKKINTETALSKIKDNKQVNNKAKLFKQTINLRINDPKKESTRNKNYSRETQVNLQLASENLKKKSKLNNKTNNRAQSRVKKQSALQNSLIKKFCNQSETVKRRCKQLAYKAAQKLLNNKMKLEYSKKLEYKNVIDKKPSFKETYEFTSKNPIHRKSYVHNLDNHIFENDINKIECKTTYDLIRPANEFLTPLPKTVNDNITIERYNVNKSYFNSYESIAPITTFNSHNYENQKHINIQKRNAIKHFMTTDSRNNFLVRGQIFNPTRNEILNKPRKNNKQNKINDKIMNLLNESVEISTYASNIHENEDAVYNNIVAQDNDNFNIAYDVATDVKFYSKDDMEDVYSTYNVNYANTYTIDVFTESILSNNQQNKTYSLQMYSKRYDNESNYSSSLFTRNETLPNDNNNFVNVDKNDFFKSEAKNSTLEPLNFCETVLHEEDMHESEIVNNFNKSDEENIVNSHGIPQSVKEHSKNNDNFYVKDTDFNSPNIDVNLNINNKINLPVNDFVKEDDIVAKTIDNYNQNFGNNLEDLVKEKDFNILNDEQNFELKPRHSFLPKGMSPIFKDNLQKISYDYDIGLDYYDREIYKNFAEDVLANHEIFEPEVVNIKDTDTRNMKNVNNKLSKEYSDLIFDSSSLKHLKVLGQVDQKFIACIIHGNSSEEDRYSDFLALFDQHAVDERVRLENNLKDYFDGNEWKSIPIDSAIKINLSEENYLYFHNNKEKFHAFGLQWTVNNDEVLIHAIPKAILGKNIREVEIVMKAVKTLVSEQIDAIKSLGGNVSSYPKSIMDLVFSEACRYANKFGDKLSNNDCVEMINKLSSCKTPFQCAHGRPVMAILMELVNTNTSYKINLNKIQKFKLHHCNTVPT